MTTARVLNIRASGSVEKAAALLKQGGLVAFPTETVYGLGADALNTKAVCRIFEAKKRPAFDPLIVHVGFPETAFGLWKKTPKVARELIRAFWPGPLTLVLLKSPVIPDVVTSGLPTVAVRMPGHPAALRLLRAFGGPLAAPSANLFGYTSATSAQAVLEDLGDAVDLVLDGGHTRIGVESTVLKVEAQKGILLRPGGTPAEAIEKFLPVLKSPESAVLPEAPGMMKSHYAPRTPLCLMEKPLPDFMRELKTLRQAYRRRGLQWPRIGILTLRGIPESEATAVQVLSRRGDLTEAASRLFQAIRKLDKMDLDLIIAEPVSESGIGAAVMDRLRKAQGGKPALDELRGRLK